MAPETIVVELQQALQLTLMVAAPMLIASLVVGAIVSLLQAATQINEQSVAFVAKLAVLAVVIVFVGPWMMHHLVAFTSASIHRIPDLVR